MIISFVLIIQVVLSVFPIYESEASTQTPVAKVNFQPSDSSAPSGYIVDSGAPYGLQNGIQYGWNMDHTDATVSRSTYQAPEWDTFIQFHNGGIWEMELANGTYDVTVSVGDAVYGSVNTLYVEGVNFWNTVSIPASEHAIQTRSVQITDGKLTLSEGADPVGTALNFIEVTKTASMQAASIVTDPPEIGQPPEPRLTAGNKVLLSGKMNNEHTAPPYIKLDGLQTEIGRYMGEQSQLVMQSISQYGNTVQICSNCNATEINQKILASSSAPAIVKAGQLNVSSDAVFGSPSKPAVVLLSGLNVNQPSRIDVYGTLIIEGNVNANKDLNLNVYEPQGTSGLGNLWVTGALHVKDSSSVQVDNQLYAGSLKFNAGKGDTPSVEAGRILVQDDFHVNTPGNMSANEEIAVGSFIANQTANLKVLKGDLFVRDQVNANDPLTIQTGGLFAVGGDMTVNVKPIIQTGVGGAGYTLLKYKLHGLLAEYYTGTNLSGSSTARVDENIQLLPSSILTSAGISSNQYSVRWTGQVELLFSEGYVFDVEANGGVRLWVNNEPLINAWSQYAHTVTKAVYLEAGKRYDLQMEYTSNQGNPGAILYWKSDSQPREIVPRSSLYPIAKPDAYTTATETDITVHWTPVPSATGYELEFDGKWIPLSSDTTQYVANQLTVGSVHTYRLRANHGDINGDWTIANVWTLPGIPQGIQAHSTSNSVSLDWEPVTGASGYDIEAYDTIIDIGASTQYVDRGLNPNTQHTYRVRANNSSGPGKWSGLIVKTTLPGIPANVRGTATDSSILMEWDPASGAKSYDLEMDGTVVSNLTLTSYTHTPVQVSSTHTYRVRSVNLEGASDWSPVVTVAALPSTPTQLKGNATSSSVLVSWAPAAGAVSYELEVDGIIIDNGLLTTYSHIGLGAGSEHSYRVRARNASVAGKWSELIHVKLLSAAPSNVKFTAPSSKDILVTWDTVVGAIGYEIEVDGIVTKSGLDTTFSHTGLEPLTPHTYRIRALGAAGIGDWTELFTKTTGLGQPLQVKAVSTPTSIQLSWALVDGATDYEVLADGVLINIGRSTTYEHNGLTPNSRHIYRVRAKAGTAEGDWSETVTWLTTIGTPKITDLKVYSSQIKVTWAEVLGAQSYEVEADGTVVENGANTTFIHSSLSPNTKHTYRIRAKNGDKYSDWSNWSTLVTQATTPNVPRNFAAYAATDSITLTWEPVNGARSYELEIDGQVVSGITTTSYNHGGLDPNTMHIYRVRASGDGGNSEWTEKLRKTTTPELTLNVGKDTMFNFVMVVPQKAGVSERKITVTYNPADVEALDLSAVTPGSELAAGPIQGTNISVVSFQSGTIVYTVRGAEKTVMNSIRFKARTNEYSKITYTIE